VESKLNENQEAKSDRQLENCNFIKTALMLLVVFGHAISLYSKNGWFNQAPATPSLFLTYLSDWIGSFHIYAFVLVSGYIYAYLRFEKNKYDTLLPFIKNKAKRLLVPYLFASACWVVPWQCVFLKTSLPVLIKHYVLGISPSQLWFLLMLFGTFILAFLLSEIINRSFLHCVISALAAYGISVVGSQILPNVFQIWKAFQCLPLFVIGIMFRKYGISSVRRIPNIVWLTVHIALCGLCEYLDNYAGLIFKVARLGLNLCVHIVGAIMAFLILSSIAEKLNLKDKKIYEFLKENSFTIYLFHQQIIYITIMVLNGKVPNIAFVFANFFVSLVASSLIAVVLNQWKVTRFLIGNKQ